MALSLKNVSINYGKHQVLKNISFSLKDNEILTLFGPSGVGKTTLLKIIAGIFKASEGEICCTDNNELQSNKAILVYQDFLLFPHMTVFDNVAFGLKNKKLPRGMIESKANKILEDFGLSDFSGYYPDELSGGQKQRVALARAIILSPKILLLDEPFSNLDGGLKVTLRDYLLDLQKKYQFSMILVTHDKDEAFLISDRIAILLDGRIVQVGRPEEVYYEPNSREIANLIGEVNYLRGEVRDNIFILAGEKLEVSNRQKVSGLSDLFIPYNASCILESSGGLVVQVENVCWQPRGTQTLFKLSDGQKFILQDVGQELQKGQRLTIRFKQSPQVFPV